MITPSQARPLRRCRQRFRTFIIASLAAIIVSLFSSAPAASASGPSKKCIEIKEEYDLRNAARDANVFIIVHEPDNKESRENLCNKVDVTPVRRLEEASEKGKGVVFAYLQVSEAHEDDDGEWHEGNKNFARNTLGVKSFPSFLFVSKGMDRNSKFSNHVTHYKGSGSDSLELSDVEQFIEKKAGLRIGNDVYNIIFFDSLASRFVSYGDATGMDRYKQRFLALLVRSSTLLSFKEPFLSIGKLYNRAFAMSLEHGMEYCKIQVEKLSKKLDTNKSKMSPEKIHEFQQKIAILRAFSEPKELTADDDKQIFIHVALHIGLLVVTVLLFIITGDSVEEEGEEEVINAQPVLAKVVDGGDENKSIKKTK